MRLPSILKPGLSALLSVHFIFAASAIITWPIFAELELFEEFYEFSRTHESWDLDEFALLFINLTIALLISLRIQTRRLKRTIKDREEQHLRAEENARHDPLTGLINRRAFTEALDSTHGALNPEGDRFIAMIDLDRFKPVNDLHGHAAGDFILRQVANRMKQTSNSGDIVGRLGGDEFAVIFSSAADANSVERSARRLLHSLEMPFKYQNLTIHISASIGLSHWPRDLSGPDAFERADKALYMAKSQGRARFAWYDSDLDQESIKRAQIESALREAIRKSDIEPWFQPIVDIESKTLKGFEVLARWTHEDLGEIPPTVFIEIAEDSGQIGALGFNLLHRACLAAAHWNPSLTLSFNLSALQFHDPTMVTSIKTILEDCAFDPARLTMEITESSVINDFAAAAKTLTELKSLGISVALDDFGTGYSSLTSLRQLPFDRVKIDRLFVTDIASQPQNQKIVSGIMTLANGLELDVTAEGIETLEDLEFLKTLDCPLGQGFLFERAVPASEVAWLLESKWSNSQIEAMDSSSADEPQSTTQSENDFLKRKTALPEHKQRR